MINRISVALIVAIVALAGPALALPAGPIDSGANVVLVRGGHGHGHFHGNRGRHLGWSIGRHVGWSHSHHMH